MSSNLFQDIVVVEKPILVPTLSRERQRTRKAEISSLRCQKVIPGCVTALDLNRRATGIPVTAYITTPMACSA
ncbi:MAG: hypothetical protein KC592_09115 [Nitrospira sp.]|nr:hypothetical protein [Nitrospira sp.]HBP89484.1 hypothetical protein [Nitrospiraceae bacterium]HNP30617.1 hypothetical protein [Nitrospirales bacterium]